MAYLALLIAMRDALDKGRVSNAVGMWPVHALFLCVGVVLLYWERLRYKLSKWRSVTAKDVAHA
jgi:lipopolysaccharide export system permease protein